MRVLITGGAGFIGSNLTDAHLADGDEVLIVDDLSTGHRSNLEAAVAAGATLEVGDICDADFLRERIGAFSPELVVHLAAQADVRKAVADPAFDARVNVIGTVNLLEAVRLAGGAPVVFSSTGGVIYGEGEGGELPFRESAPLRPETAYGASKLAGEVYIGLYRRLHGQAGVALRFGNVYGPRQDPHGEAGVVAIFCGRLLDGIAPTVFGDGAQTRDYVFVGDVVAAIRAAGEALLSSRVGLTEPLNIGAGVEVSVRDLLDVLIPLAGSDLAAEHAPPRRGEIQRVAIDPAAARAQLGWEARTSLQDGLGRTFEALRAARGAQAG